jgi:hypothetical protein
MKCGGGDLSEIAVRDLRLERSGGLVGQRACRPAVMPTGRAMRYPDKGPGHSVRWQIQPEARLADM